MQTAFWLSTQGQHVAAETDGGGTNAADCAISCAPNQLKSSLISFPSFVSLPFRVYTFTFTAINTFTIYTYSRFLISSFNGTTLRITA